MKYSNTDYQQGLDKLFWQITDSNTQLDLLVGITRGGSIPAVHLSHKLGIPCKMLHWHKDQNDRDQLMVLYLSSLIYGGTNVLLVDDISDSGKTLGEVTGKIFSSLPTFGESPKGTLKTAALITKDGTEYVPTFSGMHISKDADWVTFWWEE